MTTSLASQATPQATPHDSRPEPPVVAGSTRLTPPAGHDPHASRGVPGASEASDASGRGRSWPDPVGSAGLAAVATALAGCGGGSGTPLPGAGTSPGTASGGASPSTPSDAEAARFLLQTQFSASDAEIASVRAQGYAAWLNAQFSAPASATAWDWLDSRGYGAIDPATAFYDAVYPMDFAIWNQLMTSPDAVRKRVALALSEFFVVSIIGVNALWRPYVMAAWWDLLARHAFGNFRQLLEDVTLSPAMGAYLNTRGSQKEDASGRQPDENYAREVMQLFTLGLVQLNADGSPRLDATGKPIDTYGQNDITQLARVFTGYDFDQSRNANTVVNTTGAGTRNIGNTAFARLPMAFNAARHSMLAASFLGTTVPANTDGPTALRLALDALFQHANVGPFFCRQMIQRLVTSNPSPAYVARVAAVFANNGAGVRGDLRAVFTAIWLDDEARSAAGLSQPLFGRLREPMLRFVQWGRTFGLRSAQGSWKIGDLSDAASRLGQSPLRSPSVFNFFRPGYVPPGTALAASAAVAPEFQLVNESSVGGYLNFMQGAIRNGLYVNAPESPATGSNPATNGYDLPAAYAAELPLAADASALVQRLNLLLCAGQLSADTQALIVNALNATPLTPTSPDSARLNRVAAAVLLVMASAEYLIQK